MTPNRLCESLRDSLPTLFDCIAEPNGTVRVRTPLLYPDGGVVDVFVLERGTQHVVTELRRCTGLAAYAVRRRPTIAEAARDGQ